MADSCSLIAAFLSHRNDNGMYFILTSIFCHGIVGTTFMQTSPIHILLIEDDDMLSQLYTDLLRDTGYVVDTAVDGEKGLEKIAQKEWNLILCDIVIPVIDGLSLIQRAKKQHILNPKTKIVFLSNMYTEDQSRQALNLGDGYLIKVQLQPDEFIEKINTFIGS